MVCKNCGNTIGFVFGTCSRCGWNSIDKEYERIQVNAKNLPDSIKYMLIDEHDDMIKSVYSKK